MSIATDGEERLHEGEPKHVLGVASANMKVVFEGPMGEPPLFSLLRNLWNLTARGTDNLLQSIYVCQGNKLPRISVTYHPKVAILININNQEHYFYI